MKNMMVSTPELKHEGFWIDPTHFALHEKYDLHIVSGSTKALFNLDEKHEKIKKRRSKPIWYGKLATIVAVSCNTASLNNFLRIQNQIKNKKFTMIARSSYIFLENVLRSEALFHYKSENIQQLK
ncbi:hypothetical protein H8356DRAFT_1326986 [Neocallimastix lanati (nom. inval.)]|nr:hypothetical protein H8356DRAFT_1326986 [Neocallimastix sp. JGI-2020a]